MPVSYKFRSEKELAVFAKRIAKEVLEKGQNKKAIVIALMGDLGAGKTTFTKNLFNFLGVKDVVTSPTFLLMRPYRLEAEGFTVAYHFDWYRVEQEKEILDLGYKNIIENPNHIIVIEWADKFMKLLPAHTLWIELSHGKGRTERILVVRGKE